MNNCICLITVRPNKIWLDFLNKFKIYDIYVVIDSNDLDYSKIYKNYENINFIQINNNLCKNNGFYNCTLTIKGPNQVLGWDKALYYFTNINTKYDNVWFIEDDVFFYSEKTISNLDLKYPWNDILCSPEYRINKDGMSKEWHWPLLKVNFKPPYYSLMVCAVRMSKRLLSYIGDYAKTYKTLFFLEVMFLTIAVKHNLIIGMPKELSTIVYRRDWKESELNKINLFHPIKNMELQANSRRLLKSSNIYTVTSYNILPYLF